LEKVLESSASQKSAFDDLAISCQEQTDKIKLQQAEIDEKNRVTDAASDDAMLVLQANLQKQTSLTESANIETSQLRADLKIAYASLESSTEVLTTELDQTRQQVATLRVVEANLVEDNAALVDKNAGLLSGIRELEASLEAGSGEEGRLQVVLVAKRELEERHAVLSGQRDDLLSQSREQENYMIALRAEMSRESVLEKSTRGKLVRANDDLVYELSIATEKLNISEVHLSESVNEIKALVAKKDKLQKLYDDKLNHSSSTEKAFRDENLELSSRVNSSAQETKNALSEAQWEIDELVASVVESKMAAATHAFEVDDARQKMRAMKQRLQVYAQRVASLEVAVAEASTEPDAASNTDDSFKFTKVIRRFSGFLK
jgi:hypothetical protein